VSGLHGHALAVRVAAPPAGGAANRELLAIVASALGIARSDLELASGARGRDKRIRVRGLAPGVVEARLSPLLRV
jgi:uncharacterized protein YggU (UPF0235/DUF167 family)